MKVVKFLVDATMLGVKLPNYLRNLSIVRLDYNFTPGPFVRDLEISNEGLSATLFFNGKPYSTFIPWKAVRFIEDEAVPIKEPIKSKRPSWLKVYEGGLTQISLRRQRCADA
jgi:hypothetical protein